MAGRHHLFFQSNPEEVAFGRIRWGHASSTDLLTWQQHDDALLPGHDPAVGETDYDTDGCWSGCAVVDGDGVAVLYTGVDGRRQRPCLARAADDVLSRFVKDPGNPVIAEPPLPDVTAFRDHALLRDGARWRHVVGGGTAARGGSVFGYLSDRLTAWTFDRVLLDAAGCDIPGDVWECPDLFRSGDQAVLTVSLLSEAAPFADDVPLVRYAVGDLTDTGFAPGLTGLVDVGSRFYAPQSYTAADGRRIMIGWLRTHLDPAVGALPTRGMMSLPRELSVRGGRLHVAPVREVEALRGRRFAVPAAPGARVDLPRPAAALEVRISPGGPGSVTFSGVGSGAGSGAGPGAGAEEFAVRLPGDDSASGGTEDPARVLFDAGVAEAFRGGVAGSWTDLSLREVTRVTWRADRAPAGGEVEVWLLDERA